jgi:hypothetical protein
VPTTEQEPEYREIDSGCDEGSDPGGYTKSEGEVEDVSRAHKTYRHRRDLLVDALTRKLPSLEIQGAAAGMQLLLSLPDGTNDVAITQIAGSQGIGLQALSPLHLVPRRERGLLLGYGRLHDVRIEPAIDALASVLGDSGSRTAWKNASEPRTPNSPGRWVPVPHSP